MECAYSQSRVQAPHRRAVSEPINDYYRHKHLPRLPHEIETYRSRSLPELPPETSKPNNRLPTMNALEIPLYKNKPLPLPPLQTSEPVKRKRSTAEENPVVDTESFFPYWSKILLLNCESVDSWEEKLTFAREMQDFWTKRKLFAHELRNCALNCACGMV